MKLSSKPEVVVVTGASAGLAHAIVREFARGGASVGLTARGPERLEEARREAEALGGRANVLTTDVVDAEAVEHAAEAVEREFGPIDIRVNNATATVFAPFDLATPEEFKCARRGGDILAGNYYLPLPLLYPPPALARLRMPKHKLSLCEAGYPRS